MITIGYLSIIAFITVLIVLAEKVLVHFINKEYCRKVLHIGTFAVLPLANLFLGSGSFHFVIICAVFSLFALLLCISKGFKNINGRKKNYPGIFYYALSLLILSLICYFKKDLSVFFGVAFIGLAIGDGFATLIGFTFKGKKIYGDKTLIGFISCFLATLIALIIYNLIYEGFMEIWHIVAISMLVAIIELIDYGLDNLFIPILAFFVLWAILNSQNALVALFIFEGVFLIAFFLNVIDYSGSLLAGIIGGSFYFFAGISAILFVLGCYVIMITVSIVGKVLKNDVTSVVKKTGKKDFVEVLVNGIWALASLYLYAAFDNKILLIISLMSISQGFVDSLASDVGSLSKKRPYDIFRKQYVNKGVSGGMTLLGICASLIGAICFSIAIVCICQLKLFMILIIAIIIYSGSIIDSVLGSMIQVKYKCDVCGVTTEKEEHCGNNTSIISGYRWIDNDIVNCISGLFVFALSFILFAII